ncbi:hypothetical protein FD724_38335 (plasmid) [Nostoc sp. C057]|uniref:hypothetical protein n=1 Tax=Nostoc sp. C057 TaxID=2576903 RepID=UPI0015C3C2C2|nr:hypothetical protein [Nostoc sp. C057]QLE53717.1 hypothetical protein FD724_38335 [Nostoc sp. C057]
MTSDNEERCKKTLVGILCFWYLAQDIYDAPGTWVEVEKRISNQKAGDFFENVKQSPLLVQNG